MTTDRLQHLCDEGQQALTRMEYLQAQRLLAQAEQLAWDRADFDTLSRLYMPLQETRRQIRQRCGEGMVAALFAVTPADTLDPESILARYPAGQLLVAGYDSLEPARRVRQLALERNLYLECFLAAVRPAPAGMQVLVYATEAADSPSLPFPPAAFPPQPTAGSTDTYARTMDLWEHLHLPSLAAADAEQNPLKKMEAYRRTIEVDYACELAHQKLSGVARELARQRRSA